MKKYIVISGFEIEDFEKRVAEYINKGYVPIGGVAVLSGKWKDDAGRFYQSMLLNEKLQTKIEKTMEDDTENYCDVKCDDCGYPMEEIIRKGLFSCTNEDCFNEFEEYKKDNA